MRRGSTKEYRASRIRRFSRIGGRETSNSIETRRPTVTERDRQRRADSGKASRGKRKKREAGKGRGKKVDPHRV